MCNAVNGKMQRSVKKNRNAARKVQSSVGKFSRHRDDSIKRDGLALSRRSDSRFEFHARVYYRFCSRHPRSWADSLSKRRVCGRAGCRCNRGIELLLCGEKKSAYMRGKGRDREREKKNKVGSIEVLFHFRAALPGGFDIVNASVYSASPGLFCARYCTLVA